ncbi:hypothetical protein MMC22_010159 [Lobaria immixta]|nr:hypothetical protein [Lobaria immixta]
MFMFKSKPTAPPAVPTDKILPVHYWDDRTLFHSCIMDLLVRIDDVLDVQKLETALVKLVNRDGWRKFGARLRRNSKGKLEYHVPAQFDDQRSPISYYHEPHQISITEHSLASRLPKASSRPQFVGRGSDFIPLMRRPEDPQCLDDYLYTDRPVLGLHIVSFTDATRVTISCSHVLLDAIGRKAHLDAWSLMLQGREDEILPSHDVETDPMATLGTHPTEPYRHADKHLSTWQMMIFGLRYAFDQIFGPPKPESRVICVPAAFAQSLRDGALADIKAANNNENGGDAPFVSEGDVLCAWWTRHIISYLRRDPSQTVAINIVFGLRWLLAKDILPASSAYVANAMTFVPAFMSVRDILTKPLSYVAVVLRQALADLGSREQVEARLALERTSQEQTGNPPFFWRPVDAHSDLYKLDQEQILRARSLRGGIEGGTPSWGAEGGKTIVYSTLLLCKALPADQWLLYRGQRCRRKLLAFRSCE